MDILKIIKDLREHLLKKYGNPLENYKKTQDDVHDTYYVGGLMEKLGHKWVKPENISGEREDRAHYSENAIHDAFLAGRLIGRKEGNRDRKDIEREIREELIGFLKYPEEYEK